MIIITAAIVMTIDMTAIPITAALLSILQIISLKEKLSNYLLVAVLQAMLAVCRGIKLKNFIFYLFDFDMM